MSRDGYEGWDDQPDAEDGRYGRSAGRRPRRSAVPEDSWTTGSRAGQGSGEWPGQPGGTSAPWGTPRYESAGYNDPGGAYPGAGSYAGPDGYVSTDSYARPDSNPRFDPGVGRYESGGQSSPRTGPGGYDGYSDRGYSDHGYSDRGYAGGSGGYQDPRGSAYPESGYQGGTGSDYGDRRSRDGSRRDNVYGGREYAASDYPGARYPGSEQSRSVPDPYAGPDRYRTDSGRHTDPGWRADPGRGSDPGRGAGRGEPDYGSADRYSTLDRYSVHDQYGGQDRYGGPDQYDEHAGYADEGYAALDRFDQPGASRGGAGYGASAGYGRDGGYDDHEYGSAAGDRELDGPADRDDDGFAWQAQVDDSGLSRRSGRGGDDEIDADSARHNGFFRGFGGGEDDYGHRPPRRDRSRAPMIALTVVVLFLATIVGGGIYAYNWYAKRHADWTGSKGYGSVVVQVKPGEYACTLVLEDELVNAGVVASGTAFCDAATSAGNSNALQPGSFKLHKHMGAALAWAMLTNPKSRVQQGVAVPDGLRASKVIALLAKGTNIPLSQFRTALKDSAALGLPSWAHGNPEGFLYPATYEIPPGATGLSVLKTLVAQFNTEAASLNLATDARRAHLTEYQVLIEASLLEGEVPPRYYADVARVIDNRLNQNPPMDLGLDSTVAYATNHYVYNLTQSDLNVNSAYNTFKHPGLPPGPIDSPDAAAIEAVLHPAQGAAADQWLYFITVNKSGKTDFTSSYSQFQAWTYLARQNGV